MCFVKFPRAQMVTPKYSHGVRSRLLELQWAVMPPALIDFAEVEPGTKEKKKASQAFSWAKRTTAGIGLNHWGIPVLLF